jgi:hypothetical protein
MVVEAVVDQYHQDRASDEEDVDMEKDFGQNLDRKLCHHQKTSACGSASYSTPRWAHCSSRFSQGSPTQQTANGRTANGTSRWAVGFSTHIYIGAD